MSGWLCAGDQVVTSPDGSSVIISLVKGDIVDQHVDVIVNAANKELMGGTGVNGAIRQAAPSIAHACDQLPLLSGGIRCPVGDVRFTDACELRKNGVKYIAHAVGPDCRISGQAQHKEQLLRDAYKCSLEESCKRGATTIAFPSISTGIYAYDVKEASQVALKTVREFIQQYSGKMSLKEIRFVLFDDKDFKIYADVLIDPPVKTPRQSQTWLSWLNAHKTSLAVGVLALVTCYYLLNSD